MKPTYETALLNAENALRELIDASPDYQISADARALICKLNSRRIELIIQRKKKRAAGCGVFTLILSEIPLTTGKI